ncbi:UxaA family hydrolase [Rathayibacter soli]|uniref:UxaA family hydrolase n=1 Tax=Rathayibacter soli TaxID=3144168 RepID=UPI0027E42540|nr:UxaA family hydrolase [Glaciibacter superstes]
MPISELVLALNCRGSDGFSGITANPALGGGIRSSGGVGRIVDSRANDEAGAGAR